MITNRALEFLQMIYCDNELPLPVRMRAAMAAIPFETPKLAVTAVVTEQDFATLLDRRLQKIEAMNGKPRTQVIEAKPQPEVEVKAPLPRSNDRRYRRL